MLVPVHVHVHDRKELCGRDLISLHTGRYYMENERSVLKNFICQCHKYGCTSREILNILLPYKPDINIRYVQRILKSSGCNGKWKQRDSLESIKAAITHELQGSGCLLGYRSMWNRLKRHYNLSVSRDVVMMLLALMDPVGTSLRRSRRLSRRVYLNKGPNYLWHVDGYDKLKPYGIAIHGCIDGYSRKIMWLKAASSNNDPHIIGNYFIECILSIGGCPKILRADNGTENSLLSVIQPTLRHYHSDTLSGAKSFMYGRSVNNQRIEALWCQLRKQCTDWWISFFKNLMVNGYFHIHLPYHLEIARYCFGGLIQKELDQFVEEWNSHRIRHSKNADAPGGVPNSLYYFPSLTETINYISPVESQIINIMGNVLGCKKGKLVSDDFFLRLAEVIRRVHGISSLLTHHNAIKMFEILLKYFND